MASDDLAAAIASTKIIFQSVGRGGSNDASDTRVVQLLLNESGLNNFYCIDFVG